MVLATKGTNSYLLTDFIEAAGGYLSCSGRSRRSFIIVAPLDGNPAPILDGDKDNGRLPGGRGQLAERLIRADVTVTHHVQIVGHSITAPGREIARNSLAQMP